MLVLVFNGCGTTKTGNRVKSHTKIIFNKTDLSLISKSIISGFVYSIDTKEFVAYTFVHIGDKIVKTNSDGFFALEVLAGNYDVKATCVGNDDGVIQNLKVDEKSRVIILFELGNSTIKLAH